MKLVKQSILLVLVIAIWGAFIGYGISNGFVLKSFVNDDTPEAFIEATKEKIKSDYVGNLAMVLIENGKVANDFFYSVDKPVNKNSVFL